jgi:dUTP pyrophosphatase
MTGWNPLDGLSTVNVGFTALHPNAKVPVYSSDEAAGADLCACIPHRVDLLPGHRALVMTGIAIQLPKGFEAQVRSRSGLAIKQGLCVLNAPGTIDSDYRGEIGVILYNAGQQPVDIFNGDRIAQLVVAPVFRARFVGQQLNETKRGAGGFGSTGVQS